MIIVWVNIRVRSPPSWNPVFRTMWLRFSSRPWFRSQARNPVEPRPDKDLEATVLHAGCIHLDMQTLTRVWRHGTSTICWKPVFTHEKKIGHRDCSPWAHCEAVWAHREFTVSSRGPKWSQPAVTEPWPGRWLSCDLAVTELWPRRDWAVT